MILKAVKPIEFNFKVPKNYRWEFYLILKSSRHHILVDRNGVCHKCMGRDGFDDLGIVLDWVAESITQVRNELDKA